MKSSKIITMMTVMVAVLISASASNEVNAAGLQISGKITKIVNEKLLGEDRGLQITVCGNMQNGRYSKERAEIPCRDTLFLGADIMEKSKIEEWKVGDFVVCDYFSSATPYTHSSYLCSKK